MVYLSSRHVQFGKDTLIPYSQVEGFQGSKERKTWKNEQLKVQRLENTGNMFVSLTLMIFAINQCTTKSSIFPTVPLRDLKEHCNQTTDRWRLEHGTGT